MYQRAVVKEGEFVERDVWSNVRHGGLSLALLVLSQIISRIEQTKTPIPKSSTKLELELELQLKLALPLGLGRKLNPPGQLRKC